MAANDYMVGGTHYTSTYIHWDFVLDTNQNYLEGNATKYVSRWRKKNGVEDLTKGLHYVNKMLEVVHKLLGLSPDQSIELQECSVAERAVLETHIRNFAVANNLTDQEADFCSAIVFWRADGVALLYQARDIALALMEQSDRVVPLEDSNRHADRA